MVTNHNNFLIKKYPTNLKSSNNKMTLLLFEIKDVRLMIFDRFRPLKMPDSYESRKESESYIASYKPLAKTPGIIRICHRVSYFFHSPFMTIDLGTQRAGGKKKLLNMTFIFKKEAFNLQSGRAFLNLFV